MENGRFDIDQDWLEEYFDDVRLNYREDFEWMSALANRPMGPKALQAANQIATAGSFNIRSMGRAHEAEIFAARKQFFEQELGWGDANHPLHSTYIKFAQSFPFLKPPATMIAAMRALNHYGINTIKVVKRSPDLLAINGTETQERIEYLTGIGVQVKTINRNPGMLTYPVSFVQQFVGRMANKGFDPVYIINNSLYALGSKEELIDARIEAMRDMGLDPIKVISSNANSLNVRTELIHSKLLTTRAILRYMGSQISAEDFINQRPLALCRSPDKIRAAVRMLHDSVDPDYIASLSAIKLYGFVMMPIDSILETIVTQKRSEDFAPNGITVAHIARLRVKTPATERRQRSIDLLRDETTRRLVGERVVRAYLRTVPLTSDELEQFPDLAIV